MILFSSRGGGVGMDEPLPLNIPGWYTLGLLIISDTSSTGEAY